MNDLVFLSCPYTSADPRIVDQRFQQLLVVDAFLMSQGTFTVSPVYKHPMVKAGLEIPGTWEYWEDYCYALLSRCTRMIIVPLDGWRQSTGVKGEIRIADELGIKYDVFDMSLIYKSH